MVWVLHEADAKMRLDMVIDMLGDHTRRIERRDLKKVIEWWLYWWVQKDMSMFQNPYLK